MIEENLRRALKTWADPISREQADASRRRFLERVKQTPPPSRSWGVGTVAASLLIAAAVFWSVVSFKEGRVPGVAQDLPPAEVADVERLVKQLGDDDPGERQKALDALKKKGRRILPALRKALAGSEDPEIRGRIQEIIDSLTLPSFVLSEEPGIPGGEVAWSPDGRELAVLLGRQVQVYDTKTWKLRQSTRLEVASSYSIVYYPSGKRLLATVLKMRDPELNFQLVSIDARDLTIHEVVSSLPPSLRTVAFLDGDRMAFPSQSTEPHGLRLATPVKNSWEIRDVIATDSMVGGCSASADGKWLGLMCQKIEIVDPATWVRKATLDYPLQEASSTQNPALLFSPDSRWMVVEGGDGALALYETSTWTQTAVWQPHGKDVGRYQFTPDSRFLITHGSGKGGSDTKLRAWRIRDRREVASVDLPQFAKVEVSPADDRIVTSFFDDLKTSEKYTVRIYRLKEPE